MPCRLTGACGPGSWLLPPALTVLTSMFLHGGLLHVGGNMLYLWIFGDNIEDAMGRGRYIVFYLLCGVAATAAQILVDTNDPFLDSLHQPVVRDRLKAIGDVRLDPDNPRIAFKVAAIQ